jgi:hypothetical protein
MRVRFFIANLLFIHIFPSTRIVCQF